MAVERILWKNSSSIYDSNKNNRAENDSINLY